MIRSASEYNKKRNFDITPEPPDEEISRGSRQPHALRFVIQKHDARGLHYDFRLELEGTLKSWAVPKGPSLDPTSRRMAIRTEDHPLSYATFEGNIPQGQYGAGDVIVWDEGIWLPLGDPSAAFKSGKLKFTLIGEKLSGDWALIKTRSSDSGDKEHWLLIKERDDFAQRADEYDILIERPESVLSGELLPRDRGGIVNMKTASDSTGIPAATKSKGAKNERSSGSNHKTISKKSHSVENRISAKHGGRGFHIPTTLAPQLATLVSEPPAGEWFYEIKYDGYRMLARVSNGTVKLFTRNGIDWTGRMPIQANAIENLKLQDSWLDGEIVVLDENGLPSFQALQEAFESKDCQDIIFYLFDAPYLNKEDLRGLPIEERRKKLKKVIPRNSRGHIRFSENIEADHKSIIESACAMSLEGVIGKRLGSNYTSGRSENWIKLKCRPRQEFVIVGYTEPQGGRTGFGAILLAIHKEPNSRELIYAGRVGTGFKTTQLTELLKEMKPLGRSTSPLSTTLTRAQARGVHWIEPKLICEIEFAEWTRDGILRQAAFVAMRGDKSVKDIVRELPARGSNEAASKKSTSKKETVRVAKNSKAEIRGIAITHPGRIIDRSSKGTKLDVAEYYEQVSENMLPHLRDRPVSLLRAPKGLDDDSFFQKHSDKRTIPEVTQLDPELDPGHEPLMSVNSVRALVSCVQMNTIEFHTWGSKAVNMEAPDRLVLDLDPDPALPWRSVIEATKLTLAVLDELKLVSFLKTSGGKGMHILVPLTPDASWNYVKEFSKAISEFMAKQIPSRFVAKMGPKNRVGKIFIDYLRNARGASTVCAYSVRARPGLPVSVPVTLSELDKITHSNQWNIQNLIERLEKMRTEPWGSYANGQFKSQKISASIWKKLGRKAPVES